MIEHVHTHILQELQRNSRAESLFVLTAIAMNFVTTGVNATLAASNSGTATAVLVVTLALVIVVNLVAATGLRRGEETKTWLLQGLVKMYQDQNVATYYDPILLVSYGIRYKLLLIAVAATGVVSLLIPLIMLVGRGF